MAKFFNIFGNKKKNDSFIRRWDISKEEEIKHSKTQEITPEMLFSSMVHGICCFAKEDTKRKKIPEFQKADLDICKNYGNDASLFEVGCYLYFRLDLWLLYGRPDLRDLLSRKFAKEFIKLFTVAFNTDNVVDLFNERVSKYGDISNKNEDWIKRSHFVLSHLIAKTKDNNLPKSYKYEEIPLNLGYIENLLLNIELDSWEKSIIPILTRNLKMCCDLFKKDL